MLTFEEACNLPAVPHQSGMNINIKFFSLVFQVRETSYCSLPSSDRQDVRWERLILPAVRSMWSVSNNFYVQ